MLLFALPALGFVLADPMMSLIDSACCGQVSSLQLAALGPTTALFNFVFQLLSFIGIATTNLVARSTHSSSSNTNATIIDKTESTYISPGSIALITSMQLALFFGCIAAAFLFLLGPSLLSSMGTPSQLLPIGISYLRIRAVAAPCVLISAVASGACMGQQNSLTPFLIVVASGMMNGVGDVWLVMKLGLGAAGAALATVVAQCAAAAAFLYYLNHSHTDTTGSKNQKWIRMHWEKFLSPPDIYSIKEIFSVGSAILARTLFGMAAYFLMTVRATKLGVFASATHQIAMQMFWFLSYFAEPLNLAAQSTIARDLALIHQADDNNIGNNDSNDASESNKALQNSLLQTIKNREKIKSKVLLLLSSGAITGLLLSALLFLCLTKAAFLFSRDTAVLKSVASPAIVLPAMAAIAVCSVMMVFDGVSVGSGSLRHLPVGNALGLMMTIATLQYTATTTTTNTSTHASSILGLGGVWIALCMFYITRIAVHVVYYSTVGRKSPRNVFATSNT
jgi:putative MATE family efflux protein